MTLNKALADSPVAKYTLRPIGELTPNPKNARTHPKDQIKKIAASIKEFGFVNPILIDDNGMILAGHGRLEAAKTLSLAEVPVLVFSHLSEAQRRAYTLMDNRSAEDSGWDAKALAEEFEALSALDFDLSMTGFEIGEIGQFMASDQDRSGEDAVPDVPVIPVSQLGETWLLGPHRVRCGDSTNENDVIQLMAGQKAAMVFTDPPYGVSYADKNKYLNTISPGNRIQKEIENDHMTLDETSDFVFRAFSTVKKILAKRSSYYITAPQGGDLMMMMMMMMMMMKAGIPLRHCLIWVKNNHVLGRTDYNYKHEPILYGWADVHDFYGKGDYKFSTWEIPKPQKNNLHPTMKPVALIENACLNSTKPGDIVADIFGGSGSTLIACQITGRLCRMMEIDPAYVDVIIRRWQEFTGEEAVRESDGVKFNSLKPAEEKAA